MNVPIIFPIGNVKTLFAFQWYLNAEESTWKNFVKYLHRQPGHRRPSNMFFEYCAIPNLERVVLQTTVECFPGPQDVAISLVPLHFTMHYSTGVTYQFEGGQIIFGKQDLMDPLIWDMCLDKFEDCLEAVLEDLANQPIPLKEQQHL